MRRTLVLLVITVLFATMPCLAACLASAAPSSASHCHHKAPQPEQRPCSHQLFRATIPAAQPGPSPAAPEMAWSHFDPSGKLAFVTDLAAALVPDSSPPDSPLTRPPVLRV